MQLVYLRTQHSDESIFTSTTTAIPVSRVHIQRTKAITKAIFLLFFHCKATVMLLPLCIATGTLFLPLHTDVLQAVSIVTECFT